MAEPETRYTRAADGSRVAYQFIEGRDPVVFESPVIGHQFTGVEGIAAWRDFRDAFIGDNAWAILDYRGAGLSGRVEDAVAIADFALDFEAVAEELGDRELVVAATAAGIAPAVEYSIYHPDRVRGLFLRAPGKHSFPPMLLGLLRQDLEEGLFIAARTMYDWEAESEIRPMVREWVARLQERVLWEANDAFAAWDIAGRLQTVTVPLLLYGTEPIEEQIVELAADLPGAEVEIARVGPLFNRQMGEYQRSLIEPWLTTASLQTGNARRTGVDLGQLTTRQVEVLRLVADGHTNNVIAERLSIAPGTVARHISDILNTTGLTNRTEAARYAGEQGLLD